MSTMTKVFIVLTAVLSIAASVLFIGTTAMSANWKELAEVYRERQLAEFAHRVNFQATMEAALAMKEDALQEVQMALDAASSDKRSLTAELSTVRTELARQSNERVAAEADRKKALEMLDVESAQRTALAEQNRVLLSQNIDLQTRNTRLNSRVLELTANNTILADQARNLREKLHAAEQQVVELQQAQLAARRPVPALAAVTSVQPLSPPVAGPISGEVMAVDGNYASINIGAASGVLPGMVFMVYRNNSYVAELEIDGVRPEEACGKLMTVQQAVRAGDAVVYGLESAGS